MPEDVFARSHSMGPVLVPSVGGSLNRMLFRAARRQPGFLGSVIPAFERSGADLSGSLLAVYKFSRGENLDGRVIVADTQHQAFRTDDRGRCPVSA